jgi:hypothetical protein
MTTGFIGLTRQTDYENFFKVFSDKAESLCSCTPTETSNASNHTFASSNSSSKSGQKLWTTVEPNPVKAKMLSLPKCKLNRTGESKNFLKIGLKPIQ